MKPLFADSRPLDERARQELGLSTETMMEHAAMALEAAVRAALSRASSAVDALSCAASADKASSAVSPLSEAQSADKVSSAFKAGAPRVLIVCGSGDNGGDGYALARRLVSPCELSEALPENKASAADKAWGPLLPENVFVLAGRAPKSAACIAQAERAEKAGIRVVTELQAELSGRSREDVSASADGCAASAETAGYAVVVDCLFGSGFHGMPDDATVTLIEKLNALDAWKIACDIPSCLPTLGGSSGASESAPAHKAGAADKACTAPVFRADETVTMGALKSVLYEDFAKDWTGAITCAPLGVSREEFEAPSASVPAPEAYLLEESDLVLPHRTKRNSNKGTYGHAAVVVGDKCGAGIIAGTAALTYGAGLVTLVTKKELAAPEFLRQARPADKYAEGVCMLMQSPQFPENTTAAALGMGLGRDDAAAARGQQLLDELMKRPAAGAVIDADMCYHPGVPAFLKARASFRTVITPHPKEFSALLELCGLGSFSVKEIQSRRLEFARTFAAAYPGVVLILKGANPVIACTSSTDGASGTSEDMSSSADGNGAACTLLVNPLGMPCLAKAGSGDVLAGLTAALLAQGWGALEAAKQASLAHTCASRRIKNDFSMTPFSLIEEIAHL